MAKRLTLEIIKNRIKKDIEILSSEYKNLRSKLTCKCKKCEYEWQVSGDSLMQGNGCPKCAKVAPLTLQDIKNRLCLISPNIEILSKEYINNNTKINCKCKKCEYEWQTITKTLLRGNNCPQCSGNIRLNINSLKDNIRDDVEILSTEYKNNHSKLKCKCKNCNNEWETSAKCLLKKRGCPKCGAIKSAESKRFTLCNIKDRVSVILPNIEILRSKEYKNTHDRINCKCVKCGKEWKPQAYSLLQGKGCPRCAKKESKIEVAFLSHFKGWQKDRSILNGKELDAYFKDKKVAIEVNGMFWHSEEQGKDRDYHLQKTKGCEAQGIKLFHFFDSELVEKQDICESMINNALGNTTKIYARNCEVSEISAKEAREFCIENHIQGACIDKVRFGLFYDGELVSVMTFGKSRYDKQYEWELLRFCSKVGLSIVGGASRLLNAFKLSYNPKSLISYGNRRWCNFKSNVYDALGFEYKKETLPNYFYVKDKKVYNRQNFQRHKLNKAFGYDFNPILTENEIMGLYGFSRVYDCGNLVYTKDF